MSPAQNRSEQNSSFSFEEGNVGNPRLFDHPAFPDKVSIVFDTFWRFAAERQSIFYRRCRGDVGPWTNDHILARYKFTNAYRASDRVSQYLIANVIGTKHYEPHDVFFRVMLFKLFNKIETWQLLEARFGDLVWHRYSYKEFDEVLSCAMNAGRTIYSAAYIMAAGTHIFGVQRKHQSHLKLIERMMRDEVFARISDFYHMRQAFDLLRSYPLIGDFLAYQLATDLNYSELTQFTEMEFTIPGPGAKDGIKKCFPFMSSLTQTDIIRVMAEIQDQEFAKRGLGFAGLWGRRLQLIDIQNLFCEVDKYSRVAHPEIIGLSGRTRIKQVFAKNRSPVQYRYPSKWRLETAVTRWKNTELANKVG
jgi:hypothetical protein